MTLAHNKSSHAPNSSLDQATALLGATALIMGGMGQGLGAGVDPIVANAGVTPASDQASVDTRAQTVSGDLDRMDKQLAEFENVPPDVMVSPLTTETKTHRLLYAFVRHFLRTRRAGADLAARRN